MQIETKDLVYITTNFKPKLTKKLITGETQLVVSALGPLYKVDFINQIYLGADVSTESVISFIVNFEPNNLLYEFLYQIIDDFWATFYFDYKANNAPIITELENKHFIFDAENNIYLKDITNNNSIRITEQCIKNNKFEKIFKISEDVKSLVLSENNPTSKKKIKSTLNNNYEKIIQARLYFDE